MGMKHVYVVNTVERVERRYLVEFEDADVLKTLGIVGGHLVDDEDCKAYAEEKVQSGEVHKFTEGNADIEEVLSVEEQS